MSALTAFAAGFGEFLFFTGVALGLFLAASVVYVILTPWRELALVRSGNGAAGLALCAALISLSLPIASALATSRNVVDLAIWGVASLLIQILAFRVTDLLLKGLPDRIRNEDAAAAIVLLGAKLSSAILLSAGIWTIMPDYV